MHLVFELGSLGERKASEEGLRDVSREELPTLLDWNAVDDPLSPAGGGPAKVESCAACKSLKPRTTKRAWMMRLPPTFFHLSTHMASMTLVATLRDMRLNAPNVCQRMISSCIACRHSFSCCCASGCVWMLCSLSTTLFFWPLRYIRST